MSFHFYTVKNNQMSSFLITDFTSTSSERAGLSCTFTQNSFRCLTVCIEPVCFSLILSRGEKGERDGAEALFLSPGYPRLPACHFLPACYSLLEDQCCSQNFTVP